MSQSYLYLWRALNWPNRISLLRVLGVAPFVVLLLTQQQWPAARRVAIVLFAIIALSDALDGYLARRLGQITRLGKILDPLADKLLIACSVVLLASEAGAVDGVQLPVWVVVCVLGKDLWVVAGFMVLFLLTGTLRIQPTRVGKVCTTMQLVMVVVVLVAPDVNAIATDLGAAAAGVMGWTVMAFCVLSVASYTRLGVIFLAEAGEAPSVEETKRYRETIKAMRAERKAVRRKAGGRKALRRGRVPGGAAADDEVRESSGEVIQSNPRNPG